MADKKKTCFAVMPISDVDGYDSGHFRRVYDHLIKPACESAELDVKLASDVSTTNYIVIDILHRIVDNDLVICDLSSRNPNVMFELGIRQAFDRPVVLIKDTRTERVFDIQGLRTIDYDPSLRVDTAKRDVTNIVAAIQSTMTAKDHDVNSLIKLLNISAAKLGKAEVSNETALILRSLSDMSARMAKLESPKPNAFTWSGDGGMVEILPTSTRRGRVRRLPNGEHVLKGEELRDALDGKVVGKFFEAGPDFVLVDGGASGLFSIPSDSDIYMRLTASKHDR